MNISNVTRVVSNNGYDNQAAPIENDLIRAVLPIEVIRIILSYLNKKDKDSLTLVSHSWKKISLEATRSEEASKIKKLIEILIESSNALSENVDHLDGILEQYREHFYNVHKRCFAILKVKLVSMQDAINFSDNSNLAEVKILIYTLKGSILRMLLDLTKEALKTLENAFANINKPIFFENIFYLAITYKNKLFWNFDDSPKESALENFSKELTRSENIYDAILFAEMITDDRQRTKTLHNIDMIVAEKALEQNDTNKALKLVLRWKDFNEYHASLHRELSIALAKKGEFKEALDVPEIYKDYTALDKILNIAMKQNKITEAIEIARSIVLKFDQIKDRLNLEERRKFFNRERCLLYERAFYYINDTTPSNHTKKDGRKNIKEKAKSTFNKTKKATKDGLSKIFRKH